ncbi:hypothetical protein CN939_21410 [Bacillus thuringiensis]|uniref:hypothetical protein n=1 Tax=Bacillus thuringiensis TaxID=1428 RepID=UPI000BFB22DF|nr:hypothetical protein [Bacillus thuringiensis]MED3269497.1 hypothetical protein [Bacillus thuringiensis]PGL61721.1 hypothetical protein CN939_21410 [Bacillus thuringiensis]
MDWTSIFFDNKGVFQWMSMTAAVALLLGIVNIFISIVNIFISKKNNSKTLKMQEEMHDKNLEQQQSISQDNLNLQKEMNTSNFKGNVISKARIEWIQEVRKKSVDFMSACYNLFDYIESNGDRILFSAEVEKEFNRLKNEIEKNGTLLILYFGPNIDGNKNNDLIVYLISSLLRAITDKDVKYDLYSLTELDDKVFVLGDFLRIYFKAEWKRSNGEIKDSGIQAYLEQQWLYVKIMGIFEDEIENEKEWIESKYRLVENKYRTETS